jgi:hypothetical protein
MTLFMTLMKVILVFDILIFVILVSNGVADDDDAVFANIVDFCIRIYLIIVLGSLYDKIQQDGLSKMTFNNPLSVQVVQTPPPYAQQYYPQVPPYTNNGTTMPHEQKM